MLPELILLTALINLADDAQALTTISKVPSTGAAPAQSLVVDTDKNIWLIDDKSGKRQAIGKQVPVSDARLAQRISKHRVVTLLKTANLNGLNLRIVATTGLRADPGTADEATGKPLYQRSDDFDIYCWSCPAYPRLLHRSYEEIDDISLVDLARNRRPFVVVSFMEGMHSFSVDLFRLLSSGRFVKVAIPSPAITGAQTDHVEKGKDGFPILSTEIKEFGNFEGAPAGTKSRIAQVHYRWNPKRARFEIADKNISYSPE